MDTPDTFQVRTLPESKKIQKLGNQVRALIYPDEVIQSLRQDTPLNSLQNVSHIMSSDLRKGEDFRKMKKKILIRIFFGTTTFSFWVEKKIRNMKKKKKKRCINVRYPKKKKHPQKNTSLKYCLA